MKVEYLEMVALVTLAIGYHGSCKQQTTVWFRVDHRREEDKQWGGGRLRSRNRVRGGKESINRKQWKHSQL